MYIIMYAASERIKFVLLIYLIIRIEKEIMST